MDLVFKDNSFHVARLLDVYTHTSRGEKEEGEREGERETDLVGAYLFFLSLFQEPHSRCNYGPVCRTLTGGPKVLSFETKATEKRWI